MLAGKSMPKSVKAGPGVPLSRLDAWLPVFLAAAAFCLYAPSLWSDFVYDARIEILSEGFITSLANLPAVLTLKVVGSPLMLGDRPGHLLYLMLLAAVGGRSPWIYHLASNLLHAANVALLFVFLRRLVLVEWPEAAARHATRFVLGTTTLIFAVHPLVVEAVAAVNYSSDLLVTLFTFVALLAAIHFPRDALITGVIMAACAFAAVTCKESGLAVAGGLGAYWFLYRRGEPAGPWLVVLGAASAVTLLFFALLFTSSAIPRLPHPDGNLGAVFLFQPRLWALMFLKMIWPAGLSADYTLENAVPLAAAWPVVLLVIAAQAWLAMRSRLGALGMALFWLGLVTVSNFVPLHRIAADRFYYLPLAGVTMELTAVLMSIRSILLFRTALGALFVAIAAFFPLNLARQLVFATDFSLWTDTLRVSPQSYLAHNNLAESLVRMHRLDEAIVEARRSIELEPGFAIAHNNLGWALALEDHVADAIPEFARAATLKPDLPEAHSNLGAAYLHLHRFDEAIVEESRAVTLRPSFVDARTNLAKALYQNGRFDEAIAQIQAALALEPEHSNLHALLGILYFRKGQPAEAEREFAEAVALDPQNQDARGNLEKVRAYNAAKTK